MNGIMTPNEIVREYRMSPDTPAERRKELKVLAELNQCSTGEIAILLTEAGEKVDTRFLRKPKVKEAWQTAEEIGAAEDEILRSAQDEARVVEDADPYKGEDTDAAACITVGKLAQMLAQLPPDLPVYIRDEPCECLYHERLYTVAWTRERVVLA